jgi:hypothetical protein
MDTLWNLRIASNGNIRIWNMMERQIYGDSLFPVVCTALEMGHDTLLQHHLWHPSMTAGKIVGMLLDGIEREELNRALVDAPYLAELMVDACEVLMNAAGMEPFA